MNPVILFECKGFIISWQNWRYRALSDWMLDLDLSHINYCYFTVCGLTLFYFGDGF